MNLKTFLMVSGFALALAAPAMAQDASAMTSSTTTATTAPRVNEVDQRLQNQQNRISQGTSTGQIGSSKRAAADTARDTHVANEASKDEAANGGKLTKTQQRKLNRQLNKNSKKIAMQRHN